MARKAINPNDRFGGYSTLSVVLHWLSVVAIVLLYFYQSEKAAAIHVGLGFIAAPFLFWRVSLRFSRGFPRITELSLPFNVAARLMMFALLACIFVLLVTGLTIPLLKGEPYQIFDWASFTIPFVRMPDTAALFESLHSIAGHACIILFALHMLDALTHHFFDRDMILVRILRPVRNGK